jgi:hypothetical protein
MEVLSLIVTKRDKRLGQAYAAAVNAFEEVARKDLGHPEATEPSHEHQLRGMSVYLRRPPNQRKRTGRA